MIWWAGTWIRRLWCRTGGDRDHCYCVVCWYTRHNTVTLWRQHREEWKEFKNDWTERFGECWAWVICVATRSQEVWLHFSHGAFKGESSPDFVVLLKLPSRISNREILSHWMSAHCLRLKALCCEDRDNCWADGVNLIKTAVWEAPLHLDLQTRLAL